ncbi:MAG: hypothetical protein ABFD54_14145 [Armatimonadota bacterium]|nr:hypothetical protein [bacterium]
MNQEPSSLQDRQTNQAAAIPCCSAAEGVANILDVAVGVLDDFQKTMAGGRPKAVRIRLGNKTVAELPVALTAATAVAIGLTAVLLTKLTIEVVSED